jgi:hypothetical protein
MESVCHTQPTFSRSGAHGTIEARTLVGCVPQIEEPLGQALVSPDNSLPKRLVTREKRVPLDLEETRELNRTKAPI